ncbi:protein kinase family protein [Tengunoibacter tsumagoiensis]|uniref:Protein kinase domain-containing protein n=1 Tax=Tengunoibacter tsumagoiensis TaxID=2014871 RepID=A0A401ZWW6_9CHLR|nr:protein kinase family protein [Tengunoibacter tsumagoiensis]GCE11421.1 hypothetical protein KTT_12800 [Tengunoibacter tsumagoiensis]
MSATHSTSEQGHFDSLLCKRCSTTLPPNALFCGKCGERVEIQNGSNPRLQQTIATRYRIMSLVRRRSSSQLLRAFDTQHQRSVIIQDIDCKSLAPLSRTQVIAALQKEYDLFQQQNIAHIIPFIDIQSTPDHVYLISRWNLNQKDDRTATASKANQLLTLEELLQSGIGLPDEQVAISWVQLFSKTLAQLHRQQIFVVELDPQSIFVSEPGYAAQPALAVSWLPTELRQQLSPLAAEGGPYLAPEVLQGQVDARSDIYSLGAVLYLLLTGTPPPDAATRARLPLPSLHELNPRISHPLETIITQALSLEPSDRYQSADELSEILFRLGLNMLAQQQSRQNTARMSKGSARTRTTKEEILITSTEADHKSNKELTDVSTSEEATISVIPLQVQLARRYLSKLKTGALGTGEIPKREAFVEEGQGTPIPIEKQTPTGTTVDDLQQDLSPSEKGLSKKKVAKVSPSPSDAKSGHHSATDTVHPSTTPSAEERAARAAEEIAALDTVIVPDGQRALAAAHLQSVAEDVSTGAQETEDVSTVTQETESSVPSTESSAALQTEQSSKEDAVTRLKNFFTGPLPAIPRTSLPKLPIPKLAGEQRQGDTALKRLQRFLVGEQVQQTSSAALIETPLRIQPNQGYSIRIHIMGRNSPKGEGSNASGLGNLVEGEIAHIEVRSALYQNYAYIVQQADVRIPAEGFVAEVTMPMQAWTNGPNGRRERLHVFFMDAARNPLYEKPFVIELFISHLVQSGREGHNVLSIPL